MATYEKGFNDEEVGQFQAALGIEADGQFGARTVAAVKAWQKANGVKADGMVGPDMLLALGVINLIILENGDEGDLVRAVQDVVGTDVDGDYGKETERAVRAWQKANGLKASGSADVKTLRKMGVLAEGGEPARAGRGAPASIGGDETSIGGEDDPAGDESDSNAPDEQEAPRREARPGAPDASGTETAATTAAAPTTSSGGAKPSFASWAYQIADVEPKKIASLSVDVVVIDYAADGEDATAFKPADLARMAKRPGGGTKKLVSYMSIGEAENYRYYWQADWANEKTRPAWLDDENPDWEGNFKVRYWDPEWQALIFGSPDAYLDRIVAAGFDGVYLDIIDAFEYWRDEKKERPEADRDMIELVKRIAAHARRTRPEFLIIPQNGEALLSDAGYRGVISAQAKEDIFFGQDGDGRANKKGAVNECLEYLAKARDEGICILAVEYLDDGAKISDARGKLADAGCCAYFGPRDLDDVPDQHLEG